MKKELEMHWYLVDDMTSKRGELHTQVLSDYRDYAAEDAIEMWKALSAHDQEDRDCYEICYGHAFEPDDPDDFDEDVLDFESTQERVDIRDRVEHPDYYYWFDTDTAFLYRGERDLDGEKNRGTEEVILRVDYEDVMIETGAQEVTDMGLAQDKLDDYIESELGFLPDYEIN